MERGAEAAEKSEYVLGLKPKFMYFLTVVLSNLYNNICIVLH